MRVLLFCAMRKTVDEVVGGGLLCVLLAKVYHKMAFI